MLLYLLGTVLYWAFLEWLTDYGQHVREKKTCSWFEAQLYLLLMAAIWPPFAVWTVYWIIRLRYFPGEEW